jgi:hypothetical protein
LRDPGPGAESAGVLDEFLGADDVGLHGHVGYHDGGLHRGGVPHLEQGGSFGGGQAEAIVGDELRRSQVFMADGDPRLGADVETADRQTHGTADVASCGTVEPQGTLPPE